MKDFPKAEYGFSSDYYFLDQGILKVQILSPLLTSAIVGAFLLFNPLLFHRWSIVIPLLSIPVLYLIARLRRNRISRLPADQLLLDTGRTRLILWEEIGSAEVGRWRRFRVRVEGEAFTMRVPKRYAATINEIAKSKIGQAPEIQVPPTGAKDLRGKWRVFLPIITVAGGIMAGLGMVLTFTTPPSLLPAIMGFLGLALFLNGLSAFTMQHSRLRSRFFRVTAYVGLSAFNGGLVITLFLFSLGMSFSEFFPAFLLMSSGIFVIFVPITKLVYSLVSESV